MKLLTISALVFTLAACAPRVEVLNMSEVDARELAEAAEVRIIPIGSAERPKVLRYVGPVEATSCKHMSSDPPASTANATEQLKLKAHRLGADTVLGYACDRSGADPWGTNCWNSVTCAGTAVLAP
jgi:uncharacterized protein YbjQ (UPF0145 family)